MTAGYFINAICTPLTDDESLHTEGLAVHIADQWKHGIDGILIGGTMGMMQLLRDSTYRDLVTHGVAASKGQGEVLIGVGDTSYGRTKERIEFVNQFDVDGVVILAPFFVKPAGDQLVDYYHALADVAKAPVYLYDLPGVTGVDFSMDTYVKLQSHPNIKGAKISGRLVFTRQVCDRLGDSFRIIMAEPEVTDVLLRAGYEQFLDGIYAIVPHWLQALRKAAAAGDWDDAALWQQRITGLRTMLIQSGNVMTAWSALMGIRGIPGKAHFAPAQALTAEKIEQFRLDPIGKKFACETV